MATESGGGPTTITVHVKFSGRSIPISLSPDATVRDLKSHLQPLTNVLPRGQKLIYKGKILVDTMTMKSSEVLDGSKIMLIASHGLHQGDGPITKDASSLSSSRRIVEANRTEEKKPKISIEMSQLDRWKVTGVVALSECHLKVVPEEIWACGEVRVLDISNNSIQEIPAKIGSLRSIHKLLLNANDISDESIKWEGITSLKSLTVLSLSQNHLATLPPAIGALTSLQQLHISNNKLTSLPAEIGLLSQLQILKASNNRYCISATMALNCSLLHCSKCARSSQPLISITRKLQWIFFARLKGGKNLMSVADQSTRSNWISVLGTLLDLMKEQIRMRDVKSFRLGCQFCERPYFLWCLHFCNHS
ncbi:LRR repeats and ubiquitin-like domain-containing protein At2g30105 isoform X2 [Magnolia sinica]|uniref:LRR repeats and ubiquitin-like domain-containing protein At2g30105 isoform X2 n=1 Tax=Magnolia sinica TaxID=86752 RepID=UPI00265990AF|nr:LRR repeats and ubiquitin-like domain-containing protein At2g30105 isoform X2 [Magnolia sinica]